MSCYVLNLNLLHNFGVGGSQPAPHNVPAVLHQKNPREFVEHTNTHKSFFARFINVT